MTDERLEWYYKNENCFPENIKQSIMFSLENMSDEQFLNLMKINIKNPSVTLVLAILFGGYGIDRFYIGDIGIGVLKLLTAGGFGILWLIDIINAKRKTIEYNVKTLALAGFVSSAEVSDILKQSASNSSQTFNEYAGKAQQVVNSKEFQNIKQGLKNLNDNSYIQ